MVKRITGILLILLLLVGYIPTAYADGTVGGEAGGVVSLGASEVGEETETGSTQTTTNKKTNEGNSETKKPELLGIDSLLETLMGGVNLEDIDWSKYNISLSDFEKLAQFGNVDWGGWLPKVNIGEGVSLPVAKIGFATEDGTTLVDGFNMDTKIVNAYANTQAKGKNNTLKIPTENAETKYLDEFGNPIDLEDVGFENSEDIMQEDLMAFLFSQGYNLNQWDMQLQPIDSLVGQWNAQALIAEFGDASEGLIGGFGEGFENSPFAGLIFPTSGTELYELVSAYTQQLKEQGVKDVSIRRVVQYHVDKFQVQMIRKLGKAEEYKWVVYEGGENGFEEMVDSTGQVVGTSTTAPNIRVRFARPGVYKINVFAKRLVTRANRITVTRSEAWVLDGNDNYAGIVIKYKEKTMSAYTSVGTPTYESVPMKQDGTLATIAESQVNALHVLDKFGNVLTPSGDFSTQRE